MFQIGDYVVYGSKGIHRIMDITTLDIEGISRDRSYYVMQPQGKPSGSVYTPVDNEKLNMRTIMSPDEAHHFLEGVEDISPLDIKNNKQREDAYKDCIRGCEPEELMRVIKTLFLRKKSRLAQGKKLTLTDLHYLTQAEGILYEELSLSLSMEAAEIPSYIESFFCPPKAVSVPEQV